MGRLTHNRTTDCLSGPKCVQQHLPNAREMSVNRIVNDLRPSILGNQRALQDNWLIIEISATWLVNTACHKILSMFQNEHQQRVNIFWSCILDNPKAIYHRIPTMKLSAAINGKNASEDIASASYNWTPTEHQKFYWRLRTLSRMVRHCAVPQSHFTQPVFAMCPCIQLDNYACNDSQSWSFAFGCSYDVGTRSLLNYNLTFGCDFSRNTQHSIHSHHVGFTILELLFAPGYDVFQK
jgi:hypothetical protein